MNLDISESPLKEKVTAELEGKAYIEKMYGGTTEGKINSFTPINGNKFTQYMLTLINATSA